MIFFSVVAVEALLLWSSPVVGTDGYFHVKFSRLVCSHPLLTLKEWLPTSILADHPVNHHLLLHWLIAPFTALPLELATKVFIAVALLALCAVFVSAASRFAYPSVFALALIFGSAFFLYRLQQARVQTVSLAFVILIVDSLLGQRQWRLAILCALYPWLVLTGSVFVLPLLALYSAVSFLIDRQGRVPLVAWGLGGWLTGIVLFPQFPSSAYFLYLYCKEKLSPTIPLVGAEWSGSDFRFLLSTSLVPILIMLFAITVTLFVVNARTLAAVYLATCGLVFFLLTLMSIRFVEYWVVFSCLSGTAVFHRIATRFPISKRQGVALVAALVCAGLWNVRDVQLHMAINRPVEKYRTAAEFLQRNSKRGEMVFLSWDQFPAFFFYNDWNSYVAGLDPSYLAAKSRRLGLMYWEIVSGRAPAAGRIIARDFSCRYVVVENRDIAFLRGIVTDPRLRLVYQDSLFKIWRVPPARDYSLLEGSNSGMAGAALTPDRVVQQNQN
jgi:hypothetical protein